MSTTENLQEAFAGESQANRKYLAFGKKAEKDGFAQLAKLFRAIAEAETIHAHAHLRVLKEVKDSASNVEAAIAGEAHEFQSMYPEFLAAAQEEGNRAAEISFKNALAVEEIHHGMYSEALGKISAGNDLDEVAIYVCPVCGNTIFGSVTDKCAICGVAPDRFFEVI
jgi:rubrerythrin